MTIAQATESNGPGKELTARGMVDTYASDFARVLPSHIKPDTWVRVTQAALKTGQLDPQNHCYLLETAAKSNPGKFLSALLRAAQEGLMPGTPEFYLTPRRVKGRWEILGIVGYQGMIERMYRAGAISSVICEVVYDNDEFTYQFGVDDVPRLGRDWDAKHGPLRLVYAYAKMKDGATSKVIVLNKWDIEDVKARSDSYKNAVKNSNTNSPWFTDEAAMWMKTAIRRLEKWVPTSSEYLMSQLRAAATVADEISNKAGVAVDFNLLDPEDTANDEIVEGELAEDVPENVDPDTGEVLPPAEPAADVQGPLLMSQPPTGPDPWAQPADGEAPTEAPRRRGR